MRETRSRKLKVYVAGPYSNGDVGVNVHTAVLVGDLIRRWGFMPFVPHLTHFWHLLFPNTYESWMEYDEVWLRECDVFIRITSKTISNGADHEERIAKTLGVPAFSVLPDDLGSRVSLRQWLEVQQNKKKRRMQNA